MMSSSTRRQKVKLYRSAFGVGLSEERFGKDHDAENAGPAPGSYDTRPSWDAPGVVPLRTSDVQSRKQPVKMPGPADYSLPSTLKYGKPNRKGVMISTGKRLQMASASDADGPGPGAYKTIKSLIRQSHNIMLSGQ